VRSDRSSDFSYDGENSDDEPTDYEDNVHLAHIWGITLSARRQSQQEEENRANQVISLLSDDEEENRAIQVISLLSDDEQENRAVRVISLLSDESSSEEAELSDYE